MPSQLPDPIAARAFTTAEASALGVPPHRLRASDLIAPYRGVRVPRGIPGTVLERARAYARRMPPEHAFCGPTAAMLWGIPLPRALERDIRLHVIALDGGRAPRSRSVIGHTTTSDMHVRRHRGLSTVAPVPAWIGLSTLISLDDLVAAGDRLIGLPEPLATLAEIDCGLAAQVGRRGARALAVARRLIRADVFSARETALRLLVVRAGFPEPEPNAPITLAKGRVIRGDLVFRDARVLLEYEGEHHRTDAAQWALDLERYNELALSGWLVIRISRRMSDHAVVAAVRRAFEARA